MENLARNTMPFSLCLRFSMAISSSCLLPQTHIFLYLFLTISLSSIPFLYVRFNMDKVILLFYPSSLFLSLFACSIIFPVFFWASPIHSPHCVIHLAVSLLPSLSLPLSLLPKTFNTLFPPFIFFFLSFVFLIHSALYSFRPLIFPLSHFQLFFSFHFHFSVVPVHPLRHPLPSAIISSAVFAPVRCFIRPSLTSFRHSYGYPSPTHSRLAFTTSCPPARLLSPFLPSLPPSYRLSFPPFLPFSLHP